MTLLVTGAAGFIGSNFVHYILSVHRDETVLGLDSLTYAGNLENLESLSPDQKKRFSFVKGDITDALLVEELFDENTIDGVIHFAAESHVDRSIEDPRVFLRTNILGTCTLLDAAKKTWKSGNSWGDNKRFVQISTDEVYGSLGAEGSFSESTPLDPHSPYSASKAAADLMVKSYYDTFRMPVLITRCSNNYGPYQFPEKLIPLMIQHALAHKPLPLYGDGRQVRDWLHVNDHCRAVDMVYRSGAPGNIYNIGGNNERENIEIVQLIISVLREKTGDPGISDDLIQFVKDRPGHDRRYSIDSSRLQKELGWKPRISFEEGIKSTIQWYLDHQDWVNRVINQEYLRFYEENYLKRKD